MTGQNVLEEKNEMTFFEGLSYMKCWRKTSLLLCTAVAVMFCGCSKKKRWYESTEPPSAEKIAKTNEIRKELGLREIKDDWAFGERTTNEEMVKLRQKFNKKYGGREIADEDERAFKIFERWYDSKGNKCKTVTYNKCGEITHETDYYFSGRSYQDPDHHDSLIEEMFSLVYVYSERRYMALIASDNEQTVSLLSEEWGNTEQDNEENLQLADKVLKMWGLQRL